MDGQFLRVGLCGWQTAQAVYYQNFDLIEINSSFYKLPQRKTAQRWREQAPEGFMYTLKAWQVITHEPYSPTYAKSGLEIPGNQWKYYGSFRQSAQVMDAWLRTREIALVLRAPVVLFQCPAQFTPTDEHIRDLRAFFTAIDRAGMLCAWEPRGQGWTTGLVHDLCRELDLIHALDPFLGVPAYGSPRYFRLHGGADYSYKFTDADLELLRTWIGNQDCYCLFNNVEMWNDATRFKALLAQNGPA